MWTAAGDKYSEAWTYKGHGDEVLGLSMHPSGKQLSICLVNFELKI